MRSPLLRGEELDDLEKSTREAVELREAGIDALVELTTIGLGRDPQGVADIAARSGLHVVLATGVHREAHYPPEHWVHRTAPEELAELFIRDDRNPDPGLHAELAAAGAYLGYDGMARVKYWTDSVLLDCLLRVATLGGADRLLLGGDVARRTAFRSYGGLPGMAYLPQRFVPRLAEMGGEDLVRRILVDNPARFLGFIPPEGA
jgi:predicted metal-dependent phosphotriesterase family hydrolase